MPLAQQKRKQTIKQEVKANGQDENKPKEVKEELEVIEKIPKQPRQKKAKKGEEDEGPKHIQEDSGWNIIKEDGSLIYKVYPDFQVKEKVAGLDLDSTLVTLKGQHKFPLSADDFKFYNKHIPHKLKELYESGFCLVIFSNQNSIKGALQGVAATKVKQRIDNICSKIGLPFAVYIAPQQDKFRKSSPGMWNYFIQNLARSCQIDMKQSFYVGDAAGRQDDFDVTDKDFAKNINLKFFTPEEIFGEMEGKKQVDLSQKTGPSAAESKNPEIVQLFEKLAEHHFKGGGNAFAGRAYQKSAKIIAAYDEKISSGAQLKKLAGIGKGTMGKIDEFLRDGTVSELSQIEGEYLSQDDEKDKGKEQDNSAFNFM